MGICHHLFCTGLFQYPVCMAGHDRFSLAAVLPSSREQILLQPPLRRVTCSASRPGPEMLPLQAHAALDVLQWFRYGFLIFFLTMFGNMVFQTYLVAAGAASLREAIKLFWTFRVPWGWTYTAGTVADWVAHFSFGFYSLMLTSLLLGLIVMVLYKPRTWCAFCPMGTMTQGICKLKNKE